MFILFLSVLCTLIHTAPLPQSLTLSEFRSEGSRSLDFTRSTVIISPSYRKVRRQGRKGESLPIKFPTLKVRDPNELNPQTTKEQETHSGPVFGNSNSLATEDIESKIRDINASIETEVPNVVTTTSATEVVAIEEEGFPESPGSFGVSTSSPTFKEELATEFFNEAITTESEIVLAPKKHIVVSIKTFNQYDNLDTENVKNMLENLTELETAVYINQEDRIVQDSFNDPEQLIFIDAKVDSENKISGNIFSAGRPLENLEGVEYEIALNILNKFSQIMEETIANSNANEISTVTLSKMIIVAIRTAVPFSEELVVKIKDSLEEASVETSVFVNAPEEVIRNEFTNPILPIFVSVSVGVDHSVSGNVYYNSVPLEDLNSPESEEASDILVTVTDILKESIPIQEIPTEFSPSPIIEEEVIKPRKVVISLKTSLVLTEEDSSQLSSHITSRTEIPSILLVNTPADRIQAELSGPALPILLDMNIDQEYQLSGNILYNYQPLENIQGEEFDEAVNILTAVKEVLTEKIKSKLAEQIVTIEETTTDKSDITDDSFATTEAFYDELEVEEEEATPEPTSQPESNTLTELISENIPDLDNLEVAEISEVKLSEPVPEIIVEKELESLYFEQQEANDLLSETQVSDIEEGSGYFSSESDNLEVIQDNPNVVVDVLNHGAKGVTELPGRSKSATPGVDFGLIQEIASS